MRIIHPDADIDRQLAELFIGWVVGVTVMGTTNVIDIMVGPHGMTNDGFVTMTGRIWDEATGQPGEALWECPVINIDSVEVY